MTVPLKDLKLAFDCDPDTGTLRWKKRVGVNASFNTKYAGKNVGSVNRGGYLITKLTLKGVAHNLQVHRIIWALSGRTPTFPSLIDHADGDTTNNKISNLRKSNRQLNPQNQRKARSDNKLGFLGVYSTKYGFRASIRYDGKLHHLGYFSSPELAHEAYITAKRKFHPHGTL